MAVEEEEGLGEMGKAWGGRAKVVVGIVLALLGVVGLVGGVAAWSGVGFLGHRVIMHGEGELYVLNLTGEELWVSVDGRAKEVVHARDAQLVDLVGGTSRVEVRREDGGEYRRFEVTMSHSDVVINLSEEACLAVTDITSLYQGNPDGVEFSALLESEVEVYELGSRNVVWPRKAAPPRMDRSLGPMLSVEIVACPLLEDRAFLKEYLLMRIEERMRAGEEER